MRAVSALLLIASVLLIGGCRIIDRPTGFADSQERHSFLFKAFSADHVTLTLRTEDALEAPQSFWKMAVLNELVDQYKYTLVSEEPVETDSGLAGDLLTFSYKQVGKERTYMAAVFTSGDRVAVVVARGNAESMKAERENLLAAIRSLRHRWLFIFPRW